MVLQYSRLVHNRAITFAGFVVVFAAAFQAGTTHEHDPADAQRIVDEFTAYVQDLDGLGIFTHNLMLALPMFIPGVGAVWGVFSGVSTGYVFAAIATINAEVAAIPPITILFLSPFGIMEITAYSLACSRSFLLIAKIIRHRPIRPDTKAVCIEVGAVATLLLAGGLVERYMIDMIEQAGLGALQG